MRKIIPYGKFFSVNFLLLIFLMTFFGTVNSGNNFTPDQFREQIVQNMSKKETTVELKYDSSAEELNTDELNSLIDEALKEVDPYVVHSLDRWQVGFSGNSESVKITAEFQYHSTAQQDEVVRKNVKEIVSQKTEPEMSIHQKLKEVTDYVSR
ncbi:MAG: hypothetical protein ACOC2G_03885, partial [Bacillota bacterium]